MLFQHDSDMAFGKAGCMWEKTCFQPCCSQPCCDSVLWASQGQFRKDISCSQALKTQQHEIGEYNIEDKNKMILPRHHKAIKPPERMKR